MSTKLVLRNTQTHGLTPSGDGIWYDMVTTFGSSVDTGVVNTAGSGTEIQWTKTAGGSTIAWISGRVPSGGFTLTTTDVDVWCQESNSQANAGGRYRVFKLAANGTITELGGGPFNDGIEFGTSAASMTWTGNVTDTAFAEDDRILVRFYITNVGTMGSNRTCTLSFNAADTATGDSYFNINETVAFKPEPNPQTVNAGLGAVTMAGLAPTATASNNQTASAGLGALVVAGLAPTVTTSDNTRADSELGAVAVTGLAPAASATQNAIARADLGAVTVEGLAATASATQNHLVAAGLGVVVLAGLAPTVEVTDNIRVSADLGALVVEGVAPTVVAPATVTPDVGAVALVGLEPTATGLQGVVPSADVGAVAVAGLEPAVELPVVVAAGLGVLQAAGLAPGVLTPVTLEPPGCCVVALVGFEPSVGTSAEDAAGWAEPGTCELVLAGMRARVRIKRVAAAPQAWMTLSSSDLADLFIYGRLRSR